MEKVNDVDLAILIDCLQDYKKLGVEDPWILNDGTKIEPLDILIELKHLRNIRKIKKLVWQLDQDLKIKET